MAALTLPNISGGSPHFSTLPLEIRDMIYRHLFRGTNLFHEPKLNNRKQVDARCISKITSILRVSQQCYAEALPLLYYYGTFTMMNVEWHYQDCYDSLNPSISPYIGPTTAKIRHLVITRSNLCDCAPSLGKLFPYLSSVEIELFGSPPGKLSLTPPPKAKINLATTVLKLYRDMCEQNLEVMEGPLFTGELDKLTEDERDWWIHDALWRRVASGEGQDQYDMCLKVDLTDAIPWVKELYSGTSAARCGPVGRVLGYYQPDEQQWLFTVNGRSIIAPEPIINSWDEDEVDGKE